MDKWQEAGSMLVKVLLLGIVVVLVVGLVLWVMRQPIGSALILQPPPSPGPIVVHISGAVQQPGVYSLPYGTRLQAGLEAAGGLGDNANTDMLNLAAKLEDGQRIIIATLRPTSPPTSTDNQVATQPAISAFPVDINLADAAALESLPEIGPITAARIIAYREANGLFHTTEEIQNVQGIGPKTFEAIKDLITVNP